MFRKESISDVLTIPELDECKLSAFGAKTISCPSQMNSWLKGFQLGPPLVIPIFGVLTHGHASNSICLKPSVCQVR